jgi:hypothetical protein
MQSAFSYNAPRFLSQMCSFSKASVSGRCAIDDMKDKLSFVANKQTTTNCVIFRVCSYQKRQKTSLSWQACSLDGRADSGQSSNSARRASHLGGSTQSFVESQLGATNKTTAKSISFLSKRPLEKQHENQKFIMLTTSSIALSVCCVDHTKCPVYVRDTTAL